MKKETIADKLAKKSFESAGIQKSWEVHMQAFGPILEPAFVDDYQSRVHLTAALNFISRRELKEGIKKLEKIEKACVTDADKAAWLFFMGVCFEMAGAKDQMLAFYQEATQYKHRFYMPYLKVAKHAYSDAVYEIAEENYRYGIACFDEETADEQSKKILASAYANLASCLVMMHRYEEAEEALQKSKGFSSEQNARCATEAVLYAAWENEGKALEILEMIKQQIPSIAEETRKEIDKILNGTHPHFCCIQVKEECIEEFWKWFWGNQKRLENKLINEEYEYVYEEMQEHLKTVFPFMEKRFEIGLAPEENKYHITFTDLYMVSMMEGYRLLLEAMPQELNERWMFDQAH